MYIVAFIVSFLIVYAFTPFIKKIAFKIDFVDKPIKNNERKIHKKPIPMMASIPMFMGFFVTYFAFTNSIDTKTISILCGSILILGIGLVDDWYKTHGKEYPALPKFAIQLLAAVVVYFGGVVFIGFQNPISNQYIMLPNWLQFILTITWIFGVTTVINFSDGMDGLAGGLSAISGATLFVVALAKGQSESAIMSVILVGITLGYLRYNSHPAKIYMGDAGATLLGFILGILALDGAFKQTTIISLFVPILALGVPIFDNVYVVIKRFIHGKPVYKADSSQIHYRLLSTGLNQKQVVLVLYLANTCFCLTSIILMLLKL